MLSRLLRASLFVTFVGVVICSACCWTKAGTVETCAYPGAAEAGGCKGCWALRTFVAYDTWETPFTYSIQGRCSNTSGDGICESTYWLAIPSPGCQGDTTSCGSGTKFYLSMGTEVGADPDCGQFIADNLSFTDVNDWIFANFNTSTCEWVGADSCNKSYWKLTDVLTNTNCTPP